MRPDRLVVSILSWLVIPAVAQAQQSSADSVPHAGEWGAEAAVSPFGNGASLLRFQSPRVALLLGAEFAVQHTKTDADLPGFASVNRNFTNVSVRLGLRNYRQSSVQRLRPVVGVGALAAYSRAVSDFTAWRAGIYGELGAAYFVVPHVSLGVTGELQATYGQEDQGSPTTSSKTTATSTFVGGTLGRFLVAVYV